MYNTILVPTDLAHEDLTIQSLKKAEKLSDNGRIVLLHVLDEMPAYVTIELPADIVTGQLHETRKMLEELVEKSGVKADIEVREGPAHNDIIAEAKIVGADLILINSHRPGFQDYLLGSTAAKVVRHAPCSVLVDR